MVLNKPTITSHTVPRVAGGALVIENRKLVIGHHGSISKLFSPRGGKANERSGSTESSIANDQFSIPNFQWS
jgi:hypothetical protein